MSEALTTARPYAQAAFEEAQKLSDLKGWSEVLLSLAEAVNHPEIRKSSAIRALPKLSKGSLMERLLGGKLKPQQHELYRVLAENQRLLLSARDCIHLRGTASRKQRRR